MEKEQKINLNVKGSCGTSKEKQKNLQTYYKFLLMASLFSAFFLVLSTFSFVIFRIPEKMIFNIPDKIDVSFIFNDLKKLTYLKR
jgi:hypothetical protein